MATQNDNTILSKADLKAYHQKILPYLGGNFMMSTNNSDYYSTDEKVVGKWIDGKPIYQKTITGKTPSNVNNNTPIVDVSSWNIDKVISFEGDFMPGGSINIPINYYYAPNNYATVHINDHNKLTMILGFSDHTNKDLYITVKYTKTTDTASTALTTPGAYDINRPDLWPANKEIFFGDGLYGYRATGNFTATSAGTRWDKDLFALSTSTCKIYSYGGCFTMYDGTRTNVAQLGGTVRLSTGVDYLDAYFYVRGSGYCSFQVFPQNGATLRVSDTYDVWVTYTK